MGPGHVTGLDAAPDRAHRPGAGLARLRAELLPADRVRRPDAAVAVHAGRRQRRRRGCGHGSCSSSCASSTGVTPRRAARRAAARAGVRPPAKLAAELPDLADSWAWAHAQVTAEPQATAEVLTIDASQLDPERSVSRLSVRAAAAARHRVPGLRRAGLRARPHGRSRRSRSRRRRDASRARLAQRRRRADLTRPARVYHHWQFATGAGGDFQSLAMLLRPRPVPARRRPPPDRRLRERPVAHATAGAGDHARARRRAAAGDATRRAWPAAARQADVQAALAAVLNAPAHDWTAPSRCWRRRSTAAARRAETGSTRAPRRAGSSSSTSTRCCAPSPVSARAWCSSTRRR